MLLFLDTEYTDPLNIDLISVGLVSEDGKQEFYCERIDFEKSWCNGFVQTAVFAHLGDSSAIQADRAGLRAQLSEWFATLPRSVTVACDSFTDWELMLDALDGKKPGNVSGRFDLRSLVDNSTFHKAVCSYHEKPGHPWHHALHDARAHRMGWMAVMANRTQKAV